MLTKYNENFLRYCSLNFDTFFFIHSIYHFLKFSQNTCFKKFNGPTVAKLSQRLEACHPLFSKQKSSKGNPLQPGWLFRHTLRGGIFIFSQLHTCTIAVFSRNISFFDCHSLVVDYNIIYIFIFICCLFPGVCLIF
jgi:hypothetical protein